MSHGVHAVQHEVEHEIKHEDGHHGGGGGGESTLSQNKKIALLIAVIALFLAFSETLGKSAQTAALSDNVEASNLWAFFQAKTIRITTLRTAPTSCKVDAEATDRCGVEGGDDQAGRRLAADRGALRGRSRSARRPQAADGARQGRARPSATTRWRSITTTRWRRRRSRSASCWRRRP